MICDGVFARVSGKAGRRAGTGLGRTGLDRNGNAGDIPPEKSMHGVLGACGHL